MTNYQFNVLNKDQQAKELWENGVFLLDRKMMDHHIALYALHRFYVEVWYQGKTNVITRFRSFRNASQLDSYLHEIDISDIFIQ